MIDRSLLDAILHDVEAGRRVRRSIHGGGRIYLERPLPFLTVYRRPTSVIRDSAEQLISSQAAYLIAPWERKWYATTVALIRNLAEHYIPQFGAYLVLEMWTGDEHQYPIRLHDQSGEPVPPVPQFRILAPPRQNLAAAVDTMARSLRRTRIRKQSAIVTAERTPRFGPPGATPLASSRSLRGTGCHVMGLEVRPIFRGVAEGETYPGVMRSLRRSLNRALTQSYFAFARSSTNIRPPHYHTLGRRSFVKVVWEVDRRLAAVEDKFDLLLQATPTNAEAAWLAFRRSKFQSPPSFEYRPLAVDPSELKRQLYETPVSRIEDPTIGLILREKQDELDRRITMLSDVGTRDFVLGSQQVYGGVSETEATAAKELVRHIPARVRRRDSRPLVSAESFAEMAREEIRRYQDRDGEFHPTVEIRDDIFSGLLVSQGRLLVGRKATIPADRADALLQHEVGTHLVTRHNGQRQPFRQLALGLAGYDGFQEGLAVLAEYATGGLSRPRLRLLAARVLAVESLLDGASFVETFHLLYRDLGFSQRTAYTISMRVHRGKGLTKDASYLRGLMEILGYFQRGGAIEPLLVGKLAVDHVPLVEELRLRGVLRPPALRPHYLDSPTFPSRMDRVRRGITVLQLLEDQDS